MKDYIRDIKGHIRMGAHTMTLNGTLKYIDKIGVRPTYHCQFDARPENAAFLDDPPKGVTYLIGSMSHPSCFEGLKNRDVIVWHGGFDFDKQKKILDLYQYKPIVILGGGNTVGLRALYLGYFLGYRKFTVYGMDSSFRGKDHHAYSQPLNDMDGRMDVWMHGQKFECAPWMYRQAMCFKDVYKGLTNLGCRIDVIGDGLVPAMCNFFNGENYGTIQNKEIVNE